MVSFKRKSVRIPPPERTPTNPDAPVWVIDQTLEYFDSYDAYLKRMDFYNQKKFICELTGHSCLTYFEAVEKEAREARAIVTDFPEPPKEPILQRVQFSQISRLDLLVDKVYNAVRHEFFVGEILHARTKDQQRLRVAVQEILPPTPGSTKNRYRCDHEFYPDRFDIYEASELFRDRRTFNKMSVRTFIKYAASRENTAGCPWIVRKEYTDKYPTIATKPPWGLQFPSKTQNTAADSPQKPLLSDKTDEKSDTCTPEALSTPLRRRKAAAKVAETLHDKNSDDLEVLATSSIDPRFEQRVKKWPKWKVDSSLDEDVTGKAIQIWSFLNVYNEMLVLSPISYDEFVKALNCEQDSVLLAEVICSILTIFVDPDEDILAVPFPSQYEPTSKRRKSKRQKRETSDDEEVNNSENDQDENVEDENDLEHEDEQEDDPMDDEEETSHNHNAGQYISLGDDWMVRIGKRDFANGGWQSLVICTLSEASYMREWLPTIESLLVILADPETKPTLNTAKKNWLRLKTAQKIQVLDILVQILHTSPALRQFMDQRGEQSTKIRKERAEISRQQKIVADSLKVLREKRTNTPGEAKTEEDAEYNKAVLKQEHLAEKVTSLTNQLFHYDCQRLRLLGKDRFYNRYWWFESNGVERVQSNSDDDTSYLMSRIWVQGPTAEDFKTRLDNKVIDSRITELRDKAAETAWQEECRVITLKAKRKETAKKEAAARRTKAALNEARKSAKSTSKVEKSKTHELSAQGQQPAICNNPKMGYTFPQFVQQPPTQQPSAQTGQPVGQPAQAPQVQNGGTTAQPQPQVPLAQPVPQMQQFPPMQQMQHMQPIQIPGQQRPGMPFAGMPMYYPQPMYPHGMPQMMQGLPAGQYMVPMAMPQYPQMMGQQIIYMMPQNINGVQTLVPAQMPAQMPGMPQQFVNGQMPMPQQFQNGQMRPVMQIQQMPLQMAQPQAQPQPQDQAQVQGQVQGQVQAQAQAQVQTQVQAQSQSQPPIQAQSQAQSQPSVPQAESTVTTPNSTAPVRSVTPQNQDEFCAEATVSPSVSPKSSVPQGSAGGNSTDQESGTSSDKLDDRTVSPEPIVADNIDTSAMEVEPSTGTVEETVPKTAEVVKSLEDVEMKEETVSPTIKQETLVENEANIAKADNTVLVSDAIPATIPDTVLAPVEVSGPVTENTTPEPASNTTEKQNGDLCGSSTKAGCEPATLEANSSVIIPPDNTAVVANPDSSDTEEEVVVAPQLPVKTEHEPLTVLGLKKQFECDALLTKPDEWRYYDTIEELTGLMVHLMRSTSREGELVERLSKLDSSIRESISTREACQKKDSVEWTNKLAQETLGHLHSFKPRKRGKRS